MVDKILSYSTVELTSAMGRATWERISILHHGLVKINSEISKMAVVDYREMQKPVMK